MQEVSLKYLTTKMKSLKEHQSSSTILFLGAGVSYSAGIPLASEIMKQIEENEPYKTYIQGCKKQTYASYMNCLSASDRRLIFKEYIENSRINTSHLYAAQLVAEGYVDCVVTTNFDNLMLKGLALFNINPSVYDLTIARDNVTSSFEFPAVIYLHGQNYGFWQLNTDYELELPVNAIRNAITKISTTRAWVVVGYSGNDPVLDQLASIANFGEGLYWICFKNEDPSEKVRKLLLDNNTNGSRIIRNYNSDDFFRYLKIELGLDEPNLIRKPFTHLLNLISVIKPVMIDNKEVDLCSEARKQIEQAIKGFEHKEGFENKPEISKNRIEEDELLRKVKEIYNSTNYQEIINYEPYIKDSKNQELLEYYSYVYFGWGWSIGESAKGKPVEEKEKILLESIEKYKKAVEINPKNDMAFDNWGWVLGELSVLKTGQEKENLLLRSIENCKKALEINPDYSKSWDRWGWNLNELAELKTGNEKENLLLDSIEKRKKAIELSPNDDLAYYNWGWSLGELATMNADMKEKERLFNESIEKYKLTISLNPNYADAYNNWGWSLGELAGLTTDKTKKLALLRESIDKYKKTIKIEPNFADAYNNWGWELTLLAELETDNNSKEKLLQEGIEKLRKAIEIDNNYEKAYENWGWALTILAEMKSGEEKNNLLKESDEKYSRANEIKKLIEI